MNNNQLLYSEEFENSKKYWLEKLASNINDINLYSDLKEKAVYDTKQLTFELEEELSESLFNICKGQDFLTYIFMLTGFIIVLNKVTNESNITVSSPIYSTIDEYYDYNKCILLNNNIDSNFTFKELLMSIRKTVIDAYKNQHYPMEDILESIDITDKSILYRYLVLMENMHSFKHVKDIIHSESNYMTLYIVNNNKLRVSILYNCAVFSEWIIEEVKRNLVFILKQATNNMNQKVSDIELVTPEEARKIIYEFNPQKQNNIQERNVVSLFEEQVNKNPENNAIEYKEQIITYDCLNKKANMLAHYLLGKGIKHGDVVALMIDYSVEMAVGILGILKAGAVYLPIDPKYSSKRISFMLKEADTSILLTENEYINKVDFDREIIDIRNNDIYNKQNHNPSVQINSDSLAYIIYTSGTTGNPKGVMIEHGSLVNLINWRIEEYGYTQMDKTLQLISLSFDGFGTNFYCSLLSGGTLILPDSKKWGEFKYINKLIKEKGITNFSVVPVMYSALLDNTKEEDLRSVRMVILAGNKASSGLIKLSKSIKDDILLINEYGPTENTIVTTYFKGIEPGSVDIIGKPIKNNKVYIMNKDYNIMPIGFPGEVCIAGKGLAKGYIGDPELSFNKFVHWSINNENNRIYKTGDVARWLQNGNIQYIGRNDNQLKIRGYRVEPEEIEECILKYDSIKEAVVVCKNGDSESSYLCSYIVSDKSVEDSKIREYLSNLLPDYMIPTRFIQINSLPLNINGKVDRKRLTLFEEELKSSCDYVEASSDIEIQIANIWENVLNRERIGVNDSFFDLGGNSILLMQVYERLCERYGAKISMTDLFSYVTISKISKLMESKLNHNTSEFILKGINMPQEYFGETINGFANTRYEFSISKEVYDKIDWIAQREGLTTDYILLGIFSYMFSKISMNSDITVYSSIKEQNVVSQLDITFNQINDYSELLELLNKYFYKVTSKKYNLNDISNIKRNIEDKEIVPLLYLKENVSKNIDLLSMYDIIFEIHKRYENSLFTCEFNHRKLNEDKVMDLVKTYSNLITLLVTSYKFS